ncbi:hypothetical protein LCGC14_0922600 [marine sediment metagenome]|uniref:Uncharacterized protein n=1 Tax=marine sediment metagenome TaxID=412755 RepID=A0A0F9NQC6_9ZZZZ
MIYEIYREYQKAIAKINKQAHEAGEEARATLQERLKALRESAHEELKAIRAVSQKTRRSR